MKRNALTFALASLLAITGQVALAQVPTQEISGEVVKTKKVEVRGTQAKNLVVLLDTNQGGRVVADLGDAKKMEEQKIEEGKKVNLTGTMVNLGNHRVFFARQIGSTDGQMANIDRSGQRDVQRQANRSTGEPTRGTASE